MIQINLLPWREQLKTRAKHQFLFALSVGLLSIVLLIVSLHLWLTRQINFQESQNNFLQQQAVKLNQQVIEVNKLQATKKIILDQLTVIENIQHHRGENIRFFTELEKALPDSVVLTSIKRDGDTIVLNGRSESNTAISLFLHNITRSKWLTQPRLNEIKTAETETHEQIFTITFLLLR